MNTSDITRKNAVKIFEWCKKQFGASPINGTYPKLIFHRKNNSYTAHYDASNNEIQVWGPRHRTFVGFIGTIIHEYVHYRYHSIKRKYPKLEKFYSYKNHPMEREANRIERKYKWMCYYELFSPNEAFKNDI
jgi:predicted metalloprotease with PDZ domain